jgi:transaldolase
MNAATRLHAAGQSLWLDNITRRLLDHGGLARYIADASLTTATSGTFCPKTPAGPMR